MHARTAGELARGRTGERGRRAIAADDAELPGAGLLAQARAFAADFLAFAGRRIWLALALVSAGAILEGASLALVAPLLQIVGGATAAGAPLTRSVLADLGLADRTAQIAAMLATFGVAMILRGVLLSARQIALARLEFDYLARRQGRLIAALGAARWSVVSRLQHARITHALGNDVYRITQIATGMIETAVALVMLAVQFGIAFALDPRLTGVALLLMAGAVLIVLPLLRAAAHVGAFVTASHLGLLNDAGQFLNALKLAASQNLQRRFVADFTAALDEMAQEELAYVRRQNRTRLHLSVAAVLTAIGTAWVGLIVLHVAPATLIALLLILSRTSAPATQLQAQALEAVRALPADRLLRRLEADLADAPAMRIAAAPPPRGDIVFTAVSYRHAAAPEGDAPPGLDGFSLTLREGSFTGIAGPSGAGKTTFADLLVGLYEPQRGTIRIGGEAARLAACDAWRDRLSYVSQDPFLRHATVRENLLWANPAADDAAITRALAISGADAVVARLAEGMDTLVGERGGLISGGERQRIAIARALLRDPRLLILDEATNAIDVAGERRLLAALAALRPALTIVMIAHRLESLSFCDSVAIVEGGRVVTHDRFAAVQARLGDLDLRMRADAG